MAVPKKKVSGSRSKKRRSHNALPRANIVQDKHTGEFALSHHITPEEKYYKGRKVLSENNDADIDENSKD